MLLPPSDAALVARALDNDDGAFESLVLRHQRKAHAVARALGVPAAAGDDVVQDAFLAAYRGLASLRDREKFAPWLISIARITARGWKPAELSFEVVPGRVATVVAPIEQE
jgi:RNA polymerase sigma-70 factor (ECF subfamily)